MFRSAQAAISWAFRTSGKPIVKMSSINTMMGSMTGGSGEILSPQEKHAEAALIYVAVERACDAYGIAYLNAQYGGQLRNGDHDRAVAKALIHMAMAALPSGVHRRRGVEQIIRNYFGQQIQRSEICKTLDCSMRRYYEYRAIIYAALDDISGRTDAIAADVLERAGIVAKPHNYGGYDGTEN